MHADLPLLLQLLPLVSTGFQVYDASAFACFVASCLLKLEFRNEVCYDCTLAARSISHVSLLRVSEGICFGGMQASGAFIPTIWRIALRALPSCMPCARKKSLPKSIEGSKIGDP